MKKNNENNIFYILINDDNVNNYTKMLILLNRLNYYKDNYIPNIKLMKMLCIKESKNIRRLLKKLKENNVINIYYIGKKRYFKFIKMKKKDTFKPTELFDYNWLEEE